MLGMAQHSLPCHTQTPPVSAHWSHPGPAQVSEVLECPSLHLPTDVPVCLWWIWLFWRILLNYLTECPTIWPTFCKREQDRQTDRWMGAWVDKGISRISDFPSTPKKLKMTLNSWSSCLYLRIAKIMTCTTTLYCAVLGIKLRASRMLGKQLCQWNCTPGPLILNIIISRKKYPDRNFIRIKFFIPEVSKTIELPKDFPQS